MKLHAGEKVSKDFTHLLQIITLYLKYIIIHNEKKPPCFVWYFSHNQCGEKKWTLISFLKVHHNPCEQLILYKSKNACIHECRYACISFRHLQFHEDWCIIFNEYSDFINFICFLSAKFTAGKFCCILVGCRKIFNLTTAT